MGTSSMMLIMLGCRWARLHQSLLTFWVLLMLPTMAIAAGTPVASPTAAKAAPPPTKAATAPPPTATALTPPTSNTTASAPKSAAPPSSTTISAPAPKPPVTATPPLASPIASPPPKPTPSAPPKPAKNVTSPPPGPLAAPPPKELPPSPAPAASAPAPAPITPPDLDPAQVAALEALKVNFTQSDPCKTSSEILLCDTTTPPRHLISLSLKNCPPTANLSTQALLNLSTLQDLELVNCPLKPEHVPSALISNLKSFICTASLGRTGTDEKAAKLSGVWLSKLTNLQVLTVTDVEVGVSALNIILQDMKDLTQLEVARVNMPGVLPRKTWPQGVEYVDLSGNSIRGTLPSQMRSLASLTHLDLSDNQIKGVLPNIFGDLSQLQYINLAGNQFSGPIPGSLANLRNCSHLDLSNNQLNGTIPANLSSIHTLRYLDLSQNQLTGPIPFNSTFLNKLTTLKLNNNAGLCYNHTALKSKFLTGIRNCVSLADNTGLLAPAPGPAVSSDLSASSGKSGHISKGAAAGISVVVIVAAAAVVFGVCKWWKARNAGDEFVNLRTQ